jgi:hypothetical protein
MRSRTVAFWLLGALLVLLAAACGGKKAASPPPPTTTAAAPTTTAVATTAAAPTTTSAASSGGFASESNCAQLGSLAAKVAASLTPSSSLSDTLKNEEKELSALENAAPSEIKGDFTTFFDAFKQYADAIVKAGFTPGKTPTAQQIAALSNAVKVLETPKLKAAEAHLTAWAHKNCGTG